jgi:hypothetical protein
MKFLEIIRKFKLHEEFQKIYRMAIFNDYPSHFILGIIYKKLDKLYQFNQIKIKNTNILKFLTLVNQVMHLQRN